jgi:quercetin dioxygenase-like cupin family protein
MQPRVTPWPGPDEPDEQALRRALAREGLAPLVWGNAPGERYPVHEHAYHKVIYVVNGSIRFDLPGGESLELGAGDRLDLPAGVPHGALVGSAGVLCLEAHRAAS